MKILSLSEAKMKLSALLDEVSDHNEEVTITRNGKAVAVLVSQSEYEGWQESIAIASDEHLRKEIAEGLHHLKKRHAKLYSLDELLD